MLVVVGTHQGEGHGEIAQGVGGQQQDAVAEMDFVDAQRTGELRQGPAAVLGHIDLADLPVQTVVDKTLGEIELEIAAHRFAEPFHAHAVVEQTIDDRRPDPVAVLRTRFDAFQPRPEGLAARAAGAVFSDGDFENHDLAEGEVADGTGMRLLASPPLATLRTRIGFRGAAQRYHAHARFEGIHACVPPGLGSSTPGRHRRVFYATSIHTRTKLQSRSARSLEKLPAQDGANRSVCSSCQLLACCK